jgi:hypothetical protein
METQKDENYFNNTDYNYLNQARSKYGNIAQIPYI